MSRFLNVFQHPAVVRAAQRNYVLSSVSLSSNETSSLILSCATSCSFSTATASPDDNASLAASRERTAEASTSSHNPVEHGPAAALRGAVASAAAGLSISTSASSAASSSAVAVQPKPAEQNGPIPGYIDVAGAGFATPAPPQLLQVVPTPEGAPRDKLLVRDFIQNSLYHPTLGYFNAPTPPVGSVGGPINYWRIYCRDEFNILVKKKYEELETSFLTPAELFSPWYGACIARHMVEHRRHHLALEGQPLHIVEVGGGNGTLARDILDWLKANRPQDYRLTTYTCLEISTSLAARQWDKVVTQGGHQGHFRLQRGSGLDPATWGNTPVWDHTFVLMMEVLDNLPHDRVFRRRASEPWQQTVVRPASSSSSSSPTAAIETGPWEEVGEPVTDPLVSRTLAATYRQPTREQQLDERFNRVLDFILARDAQPTSRDEVLWLPTACAAFFELLHTLRPNHSLIAADFDKLPDVRLPGRSAPLVAQKVGGRNIDHDTLLVPWGTADIFFPTDFDALCGLYRAAAEHVWGDPAAGAGAGEGSSASASASSSRTTAEAGGGGGGDNSSASSGDSSSSGSSGSGSAAAASPSSSRVGDVNAEHFRQGAVMKRYREMFNTATICAFNPMVDDFVNARFFFGDSKNRYPPGQERPVPQPKPRLPSAPPGLGSGIKAHIPAAPASKTRSRAAQQQQQQQQAPEPVLGGRRQRGSSDPGAGRGRGGGGIRG